MNKHDPAIDADIDPQKPSKAEAEEAVRTLLRFAGDDPNREGLIDTPSRVTKAYSEWFRGYDEDPRIILGRCFDEVEGYQEMVLLKNIRYESMCEHHMAPIIGRAHIAYLPNGRVVGISKLARITEVYAKRLQVQEKMTEQIANAIDDVLTPRGVAVVIEGEHHCMATRGVHKSGVNMVTNAFRGEFKTDKMLRGEFMNYVQVD